MKKIFALCVCLLLLCVSVSAAELPAVGDSAGASDTDIPQGESETVDIPQGESEAESVGDSDSLPIGGSELTVADSFYEGAAQATGNALSGISAMQLSDLGLTLDMTKLAPLFYTDSEALAQNGGNYLEAEDISTQAYYAPLYDTAGTCSGYAILYYNYYTLDSEFIKERIAESADFESYYENEIKDRLEVSEICTGVNLCYDYIENKSFLVGVAGTTSLDMQSLSARLVFINDGLGFSVLLTDGESGYAVLMDDTRTVQEQGYEQGDVVEVSRLARRPALFMNKMAPSYGEGELPPTGGAGGGINGGRWLFVGSGVVLMLAGLGIAVFLKIKR